ncbi:unnamed protein product [Ranitomeya imitator]|uniref:Laminin subunit alpha-4 n=1 Tax=Ranitomeya imitator TaxID=111125 RepID=A0ABN9LG36_9NEOB|nr:unnamed protein product [Ranitomeya imitator]
MKVSSPKFKPRFIGPYKISEVLNPVSFHLALPASFAIHNVFHRSLLRRYVAPMVPPVDPPAPVLVEGELEYVVEKILDSRISRRKLQYLVKWKGYGQEDNSWVFASDVHAADLVRAFHLARPDRPGGSETLAKLKHYESLQGEVSPSDRVKTMKEAAQMLKDLARLNFDLQRKLVLDETQNAYYLLTEVQEDWLQTHNSTLSLFPIVLEPIAEHNKKLTDLQEALKEAQKHIVNVNEAATSARNTISEAGKTLNDTYEIVADITDLIKNTSGQHAEIDGAHNSLQQRIDNLTGNAEELVQRAVNHTLQLQRLAEDLSTDLKSVDTNGLVQKAIDASNVYEKMLTLVEDANETSVLARSTAERVIDAVDVINNQIDYQKEENDRLLTEAKDLRDPSDLGLTQTKQHVNTVSLRKAALNNRLANVLTQLKADEDDDTRKRLEKAKLLADEALNVTVVVSEMTDPMEKNAKMWAGNLSNSDFDASAYNSVVNAAGETVKNLIEVMPLLLNKLRTVEHKVPSNNISSSINRIRELIAQTRSIASKVQVSMKFEGKSAVNVNMKTSVADLKAYSSISMYINPEPRQQDRFIMYLGHKNAKSDYMGLAIKRNNLVYVYNLGKGDVEIPLDSKPVSTWPSYFSLLKIERLGRHGKVLLTIPSESSTAEEKFIKKGEAAGSDSLLDLEPENTVFYVGGVPQGFKLPDSLNLPSFVGCLELASVNDEVISLYNFRNKYNINTVTTPPCRRNRLAFTQSRAASYFFDGSGYAVIRNIEKRGRFTQVTRFDIEVRTTVDNALIFLMVNGTKFFSLEIQDGYLRLLYDFGFSTGPVLLDDSMRKAQINDARYHEISVIYHNSKKMILVVDRKHVKSVDNDKTSIPFTDIFIGGAPSHILQSIQTHLAADLAFRGCMKGFQFQKKDFNLLEEQDTIGISYGCPEESLISRSAYFNGKSFVASSQKLAPFDAFEGGFNFKTLQPSGLLLYHSDGADVFSVSMDNGAVVLNVKDLKVKSKNMLYNDGHDHFIVASVTSTRYHLMIDETDISFQDHDKKGTNLPAAKKFYFGGFPNGVSQANFSGCISNAYFSRIDRDVEVEDFQKYAEKVQVSLYGCPIEAPPIALTHKRGKNSSKAKGKQKHRNGKLKADPPQGIVVDQGQSEIRICMEEQLTVTMNSIIFLNNSIKSLNYLSAFGHILPRMIFYVSDEDEDNFITLFLANGQLHFKFNVGVQKLSVRSQEKYNDGMWHTVISIREMNKGKLVIDGLRVIEERLPEDHAVWNVKAPLYIGGVAPEKAMKNVQIDSVYSFNGCLGDLQLNGHSAPAPSQTFSVTPCFEGPMESGTYISAEGGYVILAETFDTSVKFEFVVEVRPRSNSGILFHIQNTHGEYLNLHMKDGQVVVKVKFSNKEFSTHVVPKQSLCDGQWHRIAVIRDGNVVQLDVDSEINHVVGPLNRKLVNLKEPIFVGGVPDPLLAPSVTPRNSFTGCIRNFVIDKRPVELQ